MPEAGVPCAAPGEILNLEELALVVESIVLACPVKRIRITGGEPLVRRGLLGLVQQLHTTGVELALTTNGQRLAAWAGALREAGVLRLNVSLDTLLPGCFERLTRGGELRRTLAGLEAARQASFRSIKLNTVVIRGYNEGELPALVEFAWQHGFQPRFLELMRLGPTRHNHRLWHVPRAEIMDRLRHRFSMEPIPDAPGTTADLYHARDEAGRSGTIGIIAPESLPFCSHCRRLRLTASGKLIGCLMRGDGIDLRPWLQNERTPERLTQLVAEAMSQKTTRRTQRPTAPLAAIGG